jgi:hypothetical protein
MRSKKILWLFLLIILFLISACKDQNDKSENKGDYSGVSELISGRNKARYEIRDNPPVQKKRSGTSLKQNNVQTSREDELASIILYEQDVKIVGSESGRTLANGVAYINKKGQIVRIKIVKE